MSETTEIIGPDGGESSKVESWRLHVLMEAGYPLPLAPADPLVQLVQGAASLCCECVELRRAGRNCILCRAREIVAEANEPGALLLALGFQPLRVGRDAGLRFRDQLLLPVRQLRELVDHPMLCTLEIVGPGREPRFDLLLGRCERLAELVDGDTGPLCGCRAALLGDPPFLLCEHGARIGTCAGEHSLDLGGSLFRLARDERVQAGLCAIQLLVNPLGSAQETAEAHRDELRGERQRHAAGNDGERGART